MLLIPATLISKELSPDTTVSYLTFRPMQSVDFAAGQFVMVHCQTSWWLKKKPYSIASAPRSMQEEKTIALYIKQESENGCSAYLTRDIQIWDRVMLQWPLGHYVDDHTYQDYLFISTGSGLAPNLSIATELTHRDSHSKIGFLFGERSIDQIPTSVLNQLKQLEMLGIQTQLCLSQQSSPTDFVHHPWRFTDILDDTLASFTDIHQISYFLCGKPSMVDATMQRLIDLGIDRSAITTEKY